MLTALLIFLAVPNPCEQCDAWNRQHPPAHVFGNTWSVGVEGLSVIAIDTGAGVILLDGALPQSVPLIKASLAAAGFSLASVKLIGNSHAHYDHAGGIAELQRESGAVVLASPGSAPVLRAGCPGADDPQAGFGCEQNGFPAVAGTVRVIAEGEVIKLGKVALRAHFTPGHAPGSTTWTWTSSEGSDCRHMVYADSLNAVSADGFRFTPAARTFKKSIHAVWALPCDMLLSAHPDASAGQPGLCAGYAERARVKLDARLAKEATPAP
jgi:metallo-beta-lactamase class B